jgi:hypothetical protein
MQQANQRRTLPAAAALLVAACSGFSGNPVQQSRIAALGDDYALFPGQTSPSLASEYHRGGQACTVCHGPQGDANTEFLFAGTVYYGKCDCKFADGKACESDPKRCNRIPAAGATVRIRWTSDDRQDVKVKTNCAGNFFLPKNKYLGQFKISFPALVSVTTEGADPKTQIMTSHIGREGSCAGCHENPTRADQPGQIYIYANNQTLPADKQDTPQNRQKICKPLLAQMEDQ